MTLDEMKSQRLNPDRAARLLSPTVLGGALRQSLLVGSSQDSNGKTKGEIWSPQVLTRPWAMTGPPGAGGGERGKAPGQGRGEASELLAQPPP